MTIESALHSELTTSLAADANLAALGTINVYPHSAPQTAGYPFLVYSMISSTVENYLNNATPAGFTLTPATFDIGIYSETVSARALIMKSIKDTLHGLSGDIGTENLNIRSAVIDSINTFSERDISGSDLQVYRGSITMTLTYNWS